MKQIIRLHEEDLHQMVTETVNQILRENYKLSSQDELMEYMKLRPKFTQLNVDIFVDDGFSFERYGHELLLFARNGYDSNIKEYIPISISSDPTILDDTIDYNISYDDIFQIQDFIVANEDLLIALANEEIEQLDFVNSLRKFEK